MTGFRTNTLVGMALAAAALASCGGGAGPADDQLADEHAVVESAPQQTATDAITNEPADATTLTSVATTPDADPALAADETTTTITGESPSGSDSSDPASTEAAAPSAFRGVSVVDVLVVRDEPHGTEIAALPARTAFGTPMVVGVIDRDDDWVQIQVPVRPNDLTGWVDAADVDLGPVHAEIHIDLASRTLWLAEHGEVTGQWTVAVGRPDRPTPTGSFYITDKIATGDPNSVWGAHAFGLSAYSDVLTDFIGGIGQIGLHGTNDPGSIGRDASSGCIRLPNEVIDELIHRLPLGTPVLIT